MRLKAITGIVLTILLVMVPPIGVSVGEGKRGGLLGQSEPLQAHLFSEPPETEWNKTYGGANYEYAGSAVQTSDGGYALAGETMSFGAGHYDMWLVKVDSSGNEQWNKTYGGSEWDSASCIVETSDGGYALAGGTRSYGTGSSDDFWLVKVNSTGDMEWSRAYGGYDHERASCIVETSDGGYALTGSGAWLVKVDSSGNHQWNKTYGGSAYSVVETSDGGYALAGETDYDMWLVKVDSSGNEQWNKTYGGEENDWASCVVETSDGGYALAGGTWSPETGLDFWLVKANSTGHMEWNRTYDAGSDGEEGANSIVETSDGGYALVGSARWEMGEGWYDFWLVKVDWLGNMKWNKTYGGPAADWAESVVETSDGGYALFGDTDSFGAGFHDFWLVKLAPEEVGVDWWPMFHHDPRLTGCSTSTAPNTNNTLWDYTTGGPVFSSPAVVDGKVYVGSNDGKIYCLNAATGASIWNYTTGDMVSSSPAVAGGSVYVGSWDNKVYCLRASDGYKEWEFPTGDDVVAPPAVVDGYVYVGSSDNKIYCLRASDGYKEWEYPTGLDVWTSPAVADGYVYVASEEGKVYCLRASDGYKEWEAITMSSYSSPAVTDDKVYVGSWDNKVRCLNATTGTSIWNYTTGDNVRSSPAVADGKVYVGSYDNKVYCLRASDGYKEWEFSTGDDVWSSPAVADGKVYVGSNDGKIYCLNASTGASIWNYTTGDMVSSSPAVADGKVYVGSWNNKVCAFGPPPPPPPPPVGGVWLPVNKLALLAPYIALASTILAATAIYVKRVQRRKEKR